MSKILVRIIYKMAAKPKFECKGKCSLTARPSPAVIEKLETGYKKLATSDSTSLLKKYLTKEIFDCLKTKRTSFGSTLLDCIQSGLA